MSRQDKARVARAMTVGGCLLIGVCLVSCGDGPASKRYRIERDMLRAVRKEQQLQIRTDAPPTPEQAREVLKTYERLLANNPLPAGTAGADTTAVHQIARIRAQAEFRIVELQRFLGDTTAVRQRLESGAQAYGWDPSLSLRFRRALIEEAVARGDGAKAVRFYQQLASDLPARGPGGRPNAEVLQAPIRAADLLNQMGQSEAAMAELDRAEVYYRELISDSPRDLTAAWSWLQIAEASRRRGNLDAAANALAQARKAAVTDSLLEPSILLGLAVLEQEGKKDLPAAVELLRELRSAFPRRPDLAAEALWREATCLGEMRRTAEALALVDSLEARYPRDRVSIPRGRIVAARILAQTGRWPEAQSRYRSLQADFPTSNEALGAPFEIAAYYSDQGETEAVRTTLQRAIDGYTLLVEDTSVPEETRRNAGAMGVAALIRLERWSDAAEAMIANVKRFPRDPRSAVELIQAAAIYKDRLGNASRAAEILELMASSYPASPLAEKAREEAVRLRGR
jgi:TolA-binding protein